MRKFFRHGLWSSISNARVCVGLVLAASATACSTTPKLEDAMNNLPASTPITTTDVVQRVKCELAKAMVTRVARPGIREKDWSSTQRRYAWLKKWTVKADLTLGINEQGGISPGVSLIQPLHNTYSPRVGPTVLGGSSFGAVAQNFTFGVGGGYTAQAVRSDVLTFALSFAELETWYAQGRTCPTDDGLDLRSGLGLEAWIDAALKPVDEHELQLGDHVAPTAGAAPKAPAAPAKSSAFAAFETKNAAAGADKLEAAKDFGAKLVSLAIKGASASLAECLSKIVYKTSDDATFYVTTAADAARQAATYAKQADDAAAQASSSRSQAGNSSRKAATAYGELSNEGVESQYLQNADLAQQSANQHFINAKAFAEWASSIRQEVAAVTRRVIADAATRPNDTAAPIEIELTHAADVGSKVAACEAKEAAREAAKAASQSAIVTKAPNPPVDVISQTVDFVVTANLNATPSWTLFNIKAPGSAGNFLSLNGIRTHTLDIAIGPPGTGGAKTSQAQDAALQSLKINRLTTSIQTLGLQ